MILVILKFLCLIICCYCDQDLFYFLVGLVKKIIILVVGGNKFSIQLMFIGGVGFVNIYLCYEKGENGLMYRGILVLIILFQCLMNVFYLGFGCWVEFFKFIGIEEMDWLEVLR